MKKILLICFLAPLCLVGSQLSAQSRVADSPGAYSLHRLDGLSRGGVTLSDTFSRGSSLVDDAPSSQVQEGRSSSVPIDSMKLEGMIYLEIKSPNLSDTLWVSFWDHLVSDRATINPREYLPVLGKEGNLFEGSITNQVFTIPLNPVDSYGFISLGRGRETFANQWFYSPSDRVRIRFNQFTGVLLFGGPDSHFYKVQHELDRIFQEDVFNGDPLMFTSRPETIFEDSLSVALRQEASTKPRDLYVNLKVVGSPAEAWSEFERYSSGSLCDHAAWNYLESQASQLTSGQVNLLQSRIMGEYLFKGLKKAEMAWDLILHDSSKIACLDQWVRKTGILDVKGSYPLLAQASYLWTMMTAKVKNQSLFDRIQELPPSLREELLAFYVLDNFNRMGDQMIPIIDKSLPFVESTWIKNQFNALKEIHLKEFQANGLIDESGIPFDPEILRGKTLLIHFWISGCKFCLNDYETVMEQLMTRYGEDSGILILSVNADSKIETWKESLAGGGYTSNAAINLWAKRGTGILETYHILSFPQKMIIAPDGKIKLQTIDKNEFSTLSGLLEDLRVEGKTSHVSHKIDFQ